MIRVRVKHWDINLEALAWWSEFVLMVWTVLGWILIIPLTRHTGHHAEPVIHPILLGLVVWLGPAVIFALGWLIKETFEFSFENPFDRV